MWAFCLQSLLREYGWQFLRHVALPHPLKTASAVFQSGALEKADPNFGITVGMPAPDLTAARSVVGVGFCMKPLAPACISGRFNHDCHYLEHLPRSEEKEIPPCCRQCAIREIGQMTLKTGSAFYIMTSAQDILFDLFVPALTKQHFASGLFVLCRYSLRPFAVGLLASGIRGWLFPFETGDCRDYKTWLSADRGNKEDRTEIIEPTQKAISEILAHAVSASSPCARFEKRGNLFYPL